MKRTKKLIISILVVILIGFIAVLGGMLFISGGDLAEGEKNILVCAIDEGEKRPGMGACDMCFIIHINDGKIINYTPIYPAEMTHPTVQEPPEAQAQGAGSQLLLHESFWYPDNEQSMKYAKEIVEYQCNVVIDAVVAINTEAIDAIISSAGDLTANGTPINASGIDIVREEQYDGGMSRGDAVLLLGSALSDAAGEPEKRSAMVQTALSQYNKGNIVMYPTGSFISLLATKGVENLF